MTNNANEMFTYDADSAAAPCRQHEQQTLPTTRGHHGQHSLLSSHDGLDDGTLTAAESRVIVTHHLRQFHVDVDPFGPFRGS